MKHYHKHLLVALCISLVSYLYCGTVLAGPLFYLARELRDLEKSYNWDWRLYLQRSWRDIAYPAAPLVTLEIYLQTHAGAALLKYIIASGN